MLGMTKGQEGLGKGHVVMMFSPNHVFVPVGYLGAIAAGGIFCGCSISFGVDGTCVKYSYNWVSPIILQGVGVLN